MRFDPQSVSSILEFVSVTVVAFKLPNQNPTLVFSAIVNPKLVGFHSEEMDINRNASVHHLVPHEFHRLSRALPRAADDTTSVLSLNMACSPSPQAFSLTTISLALLLSDDM